MICIASKQSSLFQTARRRDGRPSTLCGPSRRAGRHTSGARESLTVVLSILLFGVQARALEVPAYVDIRLATTFTVERSHHPAVLATVAVLPLKKNLYASLPPEQTISSFELGSFTVSLPPVPAAPGLAVSGSLAYRPSVGADAVSLCSFSGQTAASERRIMACTPAAGFSSFEASLRHDLTTSDASARTLDKVLFIVSLTADEAQLAAAQLRHLDLDITMRGRITTDIDL